MGIRLDSASAFQGAVISPTTTPCWSGHRLRQGPPGCHQDEQSLAEFESEREGERLQRDAPGLWVICHLCP